MNRVAFKHSGSSCPFKGPGPLRGRAWKSSSCPEVMAGKGRAWHECMLSLTRVQAGPGRLQWMPVTQFLCPRVSALILPSYVSSFCLGMIFFLFLVGRLGAVLGCAPDRAEISKEWAWCRACHSPQTGMDSGWGALAVPPGPACCLPERARVPGTELSEGSGGCVGHCTQDWAAGSCGLKPSTFPLPDTVPHLSPGGTMLGGLRVALDACRHWASIVPRFCHTPSAP